MTKSDPVVNPKGLDLNNLTPEERKNMKLITCPNCNHVFLIDIKVLISKYSKRGTNEI